ncbi:hypothetical protein C1T31_09035 [Hanstruepera neustonica]|uniref:Uncharacterized protein n=1 Tax=Hanstruepera neustonica TaxID=1445657 RepID=A0A2K1DYN7_9FLAO|nr:DUF6090 family protein [Hanstruepera neustonica]PNQ73123.1 hypothetical protein C1T31_09035 [Hanstruepera neustonica]
MENKTSKYLKYAVGEIILVVIGILIALQINNWNKAHQLKNDNQVYLKKLMIELDQNTKRLNLLINNGSNGWVSLETAVTNCDSLLKLTYKGLKEDHLAYILSANLDAGGSKLSLNNSTYEELINTGKLYSLGSDSLITAIIDYYKLCEREDNYNSGNAAVSEAASYRMEKGFLKLRLDYKMDSINFNINNYPWYFDNTSEKYQDFQVGLNEMKTTQEINLLKCKMLIEATQILKEKISNMHPVE